MHQYAVDNSGLLPSEEIPVGVLCTDDGNEICTSNMSCDGVNLDELLVDEKYLISIPVDPTSDPEGQVSGYFIFQTESGRVGVCAQSAYGGADISVLR